MKRLRLLCAVDLGNAPEAQMVLEDSFDVVYADATTEVLQRHLPQADAYYATVYVRLTRALLEDASRLQAVVTPTTGTDHIDLQAAAECRIPVLCLKDDRRLLDSITATAELSWALLLACARRLPEATQAARRGIWGRDAFRGRQISGKTLGLIGCGRLGSIMAQYAQAFRMKVVAYDPQPIRLPNVEHIPFEEVFSRADMVSVHVHLTENTRGIVNRSVLARMKPGAILINTSRGAIIDEVALLEALEEGRLAAAGLDVIDGEWREHLAKHPLLCYARSHDNLIVTPHIGGVTYESQAMAYLAAAEKLVQFFHDASRPTTFAGVARRGY
jgi:D-3-phosphoglycerate dehydrogenase / 2-oxoglutarate reductase